MSTSFGFGLDFMMVIWSLTALLSGGLLIAASIVLLREKSLGPYLMLTGCVISVLSGLLSRVMPMFHISGMQMPTMVAASIGGLGSLIFAGGLLFYALTRSGQSKRIAELEMLVEAQNERIREFSVRQ